MTITIPVELEPHLIGLWKFRQVTKRPTWCTTFMVAGAFYDTMPSATPERALQKALAELRKVKRA